MNCTNPITLQKTTPLYPRGLVVPCGKCLACRMKKREEWSMRIMHEADYWDKSVFVTLTYNDEHLHYTPVSPIGPVKDPWPTLQKSDYQNFMKRLRRNIDAPIKYFACGEYGENTQRPHYHAILFGLGLANDDRTAIMAAWPFCDWQNKTIRQKSFGLAEPDSIRYVAQYIDKKYSGELAVSEYHQHAREPTFRLGSQGLGLQYLIDNKDQIHENGKLTHKSIPSSIPRYYLDKLKNMGLVPDASENQEAKEIQINEKLLGLSYTDREIMRINRPDINTKKNEGLYEAKKQHGLNLKAKSSQKQKKL